MLATGNVLDPTMSDHSDVTVVMPTYNRGKELMEAVASIRAQRCQPAAIVVVDDGSDDDRALEVLEFVEHDGAEVVRRDSRRRPGSAQNSGVALARMKRAALLDDDDLWLRGHVSWRGSRFRMNDGQVSHDGRRIPLSEQVEVQGCICLPCSL
jgi:glycosyltransferase involved in cell wall biosynthesis